MKNLGQKLGYDITKSLLNYEMLLFVIVDDVVLVLFHEELPFKITGKKHAENG